MEDVAELCESSSIDLVDRILCKLRSKGLFFADSLTNMWILEWDTLVESFISQ